MSEHARADCSVFDFDRQEFIGPYCVTVTRLQYQQDGAGYVVRRDATGYTLLMDTWTEILSNDDADYVRVFEELCARARLLVAADEGGQE